FTSVGPHLDQLHVLEQDARSARAQFAETAARADAAALAKEALAQEAETLRAEAEGLRGDLAALQTAKKQDGVRFGETLASQDAAILRLKAGLHAHEEELRRARELMESERVASAAALHASEEDLRRARKLMDSERLASEQRLLGIEAAHAQSLAEAQ